MNMLRQSFVFLFLFLLTSFHSTFGQGAHDSGRGSSVGLTIGSVVTGGTNNTVLYIDAFGNVASLSTFSFDGDDLSVPNQISVGGGAFSSGTDGLIVNEGNLQVLRGSNNPQMLFGESNSPGNYAILEWDRTSDFLRIRTEVQEAAGNEQIVLLEDGNIGFKTTSPSNIIHIDEAGGTDGTGFRFANASLSTTDATLTTILTIATATDQAYRVTAHFVSAQDDGSNSAGALHVFSFKNVSGTVTEQGDNSVQEDDDSAGVVFSGAPSGTNYLVQFTGIAAENWNTEIGAEIIVVAH